MTATHTAVAPRRPDLLHEDLRRSISAGQVVAIIGAGVSIRSSSASLAASWRGLLEDGVHRCAGIGCGGADAAWVKRKLDDLENGDIHEWVGVAEQITRRLVGKSPGEYSRWLRETIGALTVTQPDVLRALGNLGVQLATTNYDSLIEDVTQLTPVSWNDYPGIERVLRREDQGVIHLHGHWRVPESIVFGTRSYEAISNDQHAQAMERSLRMLSTVLYIGFGAGLRDPNFESLLRWARKVFAGSEFRHFRLAKADEVDRIQATHPDEDRIFVLSFGNDHDDLSTFLDGLRTPG